MENSVYDIAIIGGGINGCGIARDVAGRGLSVFLCERDDLASGTSSASTKLIHGGLRYLEYYEFRLVREALKEREVLLRNAPHIIWPLRFILPHLPGLRPAWLIRLGLFLYDNLGGRELLPGTSVVDLRQDPAGNVLKPIFSKGFEYSDCWVMDSRLVVLNAIDAARWGAKIVTRTVCLGAKREDELWHLTLRDNIDDTETTIAAKVLINASGPWMDSTMATIDHQTSREHIRMVKGSHIIVSSLFSDPRAFIFQNKDGRIIFAIPYADDFTLIGTTDVDFHGDPGSVAISEEEIRYLCDAASEYFLATICPSDVVSSYSGIRPLFDDGKSEAKAATRDYVLKLDHQEGKAPLLAIYGGKITTYRKLAESVLAKLHRYFPQMKAPWTEDKALPGGEFRVQDFELQIERVINRCPLLQATHAKRLVRNYGTMAHDLVRDLISKEDMGIYFGADLYQFEVEYLIRHEWARTAEDVLRRRTNVGLFLNGDEKATLENWMIERIRSDRQPDKEK